MRLGKNAQVACGWEGGAPVRVKRVSTGLLMAATMRVRVDGLASMPICPIRAPISVSSTVPDRLMSRQLNHSVSSASSRGE